MKQVAPAVHTWARIGHEHLGVTSPEKTHTGLRTIPGIQPRWGKLHCCGLVVP